MTTSHRSMAAVDFRRETIFVTIAMAINSNRAASTELSLTISKMMILEETVADIAL